MTPAQSLSPVVGVTVAKSEAWGETVCTAAPWGDTSTPSSPTAPSSHQVRDGWNPSLGDKGEADVPVPRMESGAHGDGAGPTQTPARPSSATGTAMRASDVRCFEICRSPGLSSVLGEGPARLGALWPPQTRLLSQPGAPGVLPQFPSPPEGALNPTS